jgi:ribosome-associated translation inhibitor RaiA
MQISGDVIAILSFAFTVQVTLIAFVWKSATTTTSQDHRIAQLEKDRNSLVAAFERAVDRFTRSIEKLDKRLSINEVVDQLKDARESRPSAIRSTGSDKDTI